MFTSFVVRLKPVIFVWIILKKIIFIYFFNSAQQSFSGLILWCPFQRLLRPNYNFLMNEFVFYCRQCIFYYFGSRKKNYFIALTKSKFFYNFLSMFFFLKRMNNNSYFKNNFCSIQIYIFVHNRIYTSTTSYTSRSLPVQNQFVTQQGDATNLPSDRENF